MIASGLKRVALLAFVSAMLLAGPALADDASDIKQVISAQLEAFREGDGAQAYSYAAPNIKAMFPTAEAFMTMVQTGYAPVYNSSTALFGGLRPEGAGFRQEVYLTDQQGRSWIASYTLERQPDGSMKITSCMIRKSDAISV